ncbi:Protein LURP-one-related 6 [Zea mays]|uniref:Protein LURP-one-related 6 n=2 Tax=Zea mays TaxID=4577 RepID=A0A8J8YJ98_MAIZE|nr:Protein LURP-one-related 6 [Zea mays]PWZ39919.1 Protein LURP-one-related 6 [Zea mays]
MDKSIPVVSKIFCSGTPTMLMIRMRPIVVNGGGFVVTDLSHNIVFVVDGCGILGSKGELMVKDGEGEPILFISKKMGTKEPIGGKDFYHVEVQSGYDQAFIIGVMAILDNIHGESTRC